MKIAKTLILVLMMFNSITLLAVKDSAEVWKSPTIAQKKQINYKNALYNAIIKNDVKTIKNLLDDQKEEDNKTLINESLNDGLTALQKALSIKRINYKVIKILLCHGADPNQLINAHREEHLHLSKPYYEGWTSCHLAIQNVSPKILKLLLKHGADLTRIDSEGWTPIDVLSNKIKKLTQSKIFLEKQGLWQTQIQNSLAIERRDEDFMAEYQNESESEFQITPDYLTLFMPLFVLFSLILYSVYQ